jgi:hypothetical protein
MSSSICTFRHDRSVVQALQGGKEIDGHILRTSLPVWGMLESARKWISSGWGSGCHVPRWTTCVWWRSLMLRLQCKRNMGLQNRNLSQGALWSCEGTRNNCILDCIWFQMPAMAHEILFFFFCPLLTIGGDTKGWRYLCVFRRRYMDFYFFTFSLFCKEEDEPKWFCFVLQKIGEHFFLNKIITENWNEPYCFHEDVLRTCISIRIF